MTDPLTVAKAAKVGHLGFKFWRRYEIGKKINRKLFPKWMARRDAKKAARGESVLQHDEVSMSADVLQGKKSWIGLVALLGGVGLKMAGVGECTAEELAAASCVPADTIISMLVATLDQILIAIGSAVTAWGVLMKQIREKRLKAQLEAAAKSP